MNNPTFKIKLKSNEEIANIKRIELHTHQRTVATHQIVASVFLQRI